MNILATGNPDLPAWLRLATANSNPATTPASRARPVSSEPAVGLLGLIQGLSDSGLLHLLAGGGVDPANDTATRSAEPSRAVEDLASLRNVSGIADMILARDAGSIDRDQFGSSGAESASGSRSGTQTAYDKLDCDDAYRACLDARGGMIKAAGVCGQARKNCRENGQTTIFAPGIVGSPR